MPGHRVPQRALAPIYVVVIVVAVITIATLIAYEAREASSITEAVFSIAAVDYASYSGTYSETTTVKINNVDVPVSWDEKAVAVMVLGGMRYSINNFETYYINYLQWLYGEKETDPWPAGTCYLTSIEDNFRPSPIREDTKIKTIVVSTEYWSQISEDIRNRWMQAGVVVEQGGSMTVEVPVSLYEYYNYAVAHFYKGEDPWLGSGCQDLQETATRNLFIDVYIPQIG